METDPLCNCIVCPACRGRGFRGGIELTEWCDTFERPVSFAARICQAERERFLQEMA